MPDDTQIDLRQAIAELRRQLESRTTERDEALAREAAMAEVVEVINSSPGDLDPVFQAIVEKAHTLCGAACGSLQLWDGEKFRGVAMRGFPEPMVEALRQGYSAGSNHPCRGLIDGARIAHCPDMAAVDDPVTQLGAQLSGIRTVAYVALRKDDALLGQIVAGRLEVRPFNHAELALLENFAAQAVIAMENARLLTETREALEQQTATAEVLQVINSSPGDLAPVFDAMLDKAMRLCEAAFGILLVGDGSHFKTAALHGVPAALAEFLSRTPREPGKHTAVGRMLEGEDFVHFEDMTKEPAYRLGDPRQRAFVELGGTRTYVAVALRKDGRLVGTIGAYRQEVRPFTEKQIALLRNFAAQAVIAMENARLLGELRERTRDLEESLNYQTATSEVLKVISQSDADLTYLLQTALDTAARLCEAETGHIFLRRGERLQRMASSIGVSTEWRADMDVNPVAVDAHSASGRAVLTGQVVHIADIAADPEYAHTSTGAAGIRTMLGVPLLRDGVPIGSMSLARKVVEPFTHKQIALVTTFADQAVIAIENARLLTETREALEQQTATAEVLQVINSSPGDLTPVFNAMLEKALRLCGADFGLMNTYDGERFHHAADYGVPAAFSENRRQSPLVFGPGTAPARLIAGEDVVHNVDLMAEEAYQLGEPNRRALVDLGGARSHVAVALRKDGTLLGHLGIYRKEVRSFSDKQIALLQNFAAQAVIAMENARLISETREALEQQTATAEVLQVINSSPGDLAPVFDALLEKAVDLCDASFGLLMKYDGAGFQAVAHYNSPPAFVEVLRQPVLPAPGMAGYRILRGEDVVAFADVAADPRYAAASEVARRLVETSGARSHVTIALRKDGNLLGQIVIYHREVRPFTDKQIALLQNFAAQAVIAMENARLLTETREALEQQTATAEVLQVINSSPGDLAPVFNAMLERAMRLCEAAFGSLWTLNGDRFQPVAHHGIPARYAEYLAHEVPAAGPGTGRARLLAGAPFAHIVDLADDAPYRDGEPHRRALVDLGGARTALLVPLRRDEAVIGLFMIYRQEVRPFTDKQIALLQNFAAQAVIAIENARLLDEIRQRQQELRVTFDNMGDGVVMFDEEVRLAAWNRNFQELLDLPDALLAERPSYADYLRVLAERGEFGSDGIDAELSRRLEDTGEELRLERTRPNSRVIEVRRNAVPDGGFVLIYSDITERKRSEAEIRAARDAAETAYRDLKAAQASLIQAEKMASLGQLTAGIAHEIKNPLNFVNNFAGLSVELLDELKETVAPVIDALDDDNRAEIDETITMLTGNLEKIAEHGRRADGIVKSMLEHSRGTSGERRSVDFNNLIEEALNLAYHGARAQDASFNITLERDYAAALAPIELVPQDITRVCLNLIGNGFYATTKRQKEGGDRNFKPTLKLSTRDFVDAVEVRIRDNGIGIPAELRDKLFQPFFTTKPTGEGTGLGLSISYDIVTQQHGGTITVESEPGAYTEFTIRLPRRSVGGAA